MVSQIMEAPLPNNEADRLMALGTYQILDTEPEKSFDDLTNLAAQICQAPIALVSFVDQNRQWFKSRVGLETTETPRTLAFCAYAILQSDLFVVEDALLDPRFANNELVTAEPFIRFYAGAPLVTADGFALGTLCVIDYVPRQLNETQAEALRALGRQVVSQLELKHNSKALSQAISDRQIAEEALDQERVLLSNILETTDELVRNFVSTVLDTSNALVIVLDAQSQILRLNQVCISTTGFSFEEAQGKFFWDVFIAPETVLQAQAALKQLHNQQVTYEYESRCLTKNGEVRTIAWSHSVLRNSSESLKHIICTGIDITERKRAEEERDRFFTLSADMLCITDFEGYFKFLNPAWERVLGFSHQELLSQPFLNLVHPEDLAATISALQSLEVGNEIAGFENRYQRHDGSYKWLSWNATPFAEQGLVYAVARDISDRKAAEAEMQETQMFLNSIVENIPHMIFVKDAKDLRFIKYNRAGEELLGLARSELVGKTDYNLFPKAEADFFVAKDREVLESRAPISIPHETIQTRYKGIRILHTRKIPLFDPQGELQYLLGISEDITERKRAEAALQESEQQYRLVVDNIKEVIFQLSEEGYWTFLNPAWTEVTGFSLGESIGNSILEYLHPEDHSEYEGLQQVLAGKTKSYRRELRFITETGQVRWLDVYAQRMLAQSGYLLGISGTLNDITERKQAELALRESEAKLQKMALNIPGLIYQFVLRVDGSMAFPFVSPGCRELYELEPSVIQQSAAAVLEMIHPSDRHNFYVSLKLSARTLQPWSWQGRFILPSKTVKWVQVAARPESQPNGDMFWDGMMMDISDRKWAEDELQKSNQRVAKILESITDAFFALDRDWRFTYINAQAEQILSRQRDQLIGQSIWEQFPEIVDSQFHDEFHQASQQQVTVHFEALFPSQDNWFEVQAYPYQEGLSVYFRDVTSRKQAETALVERSRLSTLSAEVSVALARGGSLPEALDCFVNAIAKQLDATFVRVWTFNSETNLLELQAIAGQHSHTDDFSSLIPLGISIIGFIAQNQSPYLTNDVSNDLCIGAQDWIHQEELVAFAGYPLIVEERLMGVMALFSRQPLTETTYSSLSWVANSIAVTIDRAWAREELLSRREALMLRLANQIRNSLDLDTILETAVTEIRSLLRIDRCHFLWCWPHPDQSSLAITHEAKHTALNSLLGDFPPNHIEIIVQQILQLEVVRIDDVANDSSIDVELQGLLTQLDITSQLLLPLKTRSGQFGAIVCSHASGPRSWHESEVELLQAVTDQLAIAIDQAELYAQTRAAAFAAQTQAKQLTAALQHLKQTQTQLIQTEKMSSLGQLVAGVAHEINNPVNFISGNLVYADDYIQDLLKVLHLYREHYPEPIADIQQIIDQIDLPFLTEDLLKILSSMKMGADRIRQIVLSLRNFSRLDEADMKPVNIHEGLDNTLLILQNRLKASPDHAGIQVEKEYGSLPLVECYAGQLNQVFMNILSNAIDALEEHNQPGLITIKTEILPSSDHQPDQVLICIRDNGPGMSESVLGRLFDPFFTTKEVGKGTGLGLSISYQIVVDKHGGTLKCLSTPGEGAEFWIQIPIAPPAAWRPTEALVADQP